MHYHDSINIRRFVDRMGPVHRRLLTSRFNIRQLVVVNYRAAINELRQLVPNCVGIDEIGSSGMGIINLIACEMNFTHLGLLPLPDFPVVEISYGINVQLPRQSKWRRARYVLRTDTASTADALLGRHFSHRRVVHSDISCFGQHNHYRWCCNAADPLGDCHVSLSTDALSYSRPFGSLLESTQSATDFVLGVDGSCGFDYRNQRLLFEPWNRPKWDTQFGQDLDVRSALFDYLFDLFQIDAELESTLYCKNSNLIRQKTIALKNDKWQPELNKKSRQLQRGRVDQSMEELS